MSKYDKLIQEVWPSVFDTEEFDENVKNAILNIINDRISFKNKDVLRLARQFNYDKSILVALAKNKHVSIDSVNTLLHYKFTNEIAFATLQREDIDRDTYNLIKKIDKGNIFVDAFLSQNIETKGASFSQHTYQYLAYDCLHGDFHGMKNFLSFLFIKDKSFLEDVIDNYKIETALKTSVSSDKLIECEEIVRSILASNTSLDEETRNQLFDMGYSCNFIFNMTKHMSDVVYQVNTDSYFMNEDEMRNNNIKDGKIFKEKSAEILYGLISRNQLNASKRNDLINRFLNLPEIDTKTDQGDLFHILVFKEKDEDLLLKVAQSKTGGKMFVEIYSNYNVTRRVFRVFAEKELEKIRKKINTGKPIYLTGHIITEIECGQDTPHKNDALSYTEKHMPYTDDEYKTILKINSQSLNVYFAESYTTPEWVIDALLEKEDSLLNESNKIIAIANKFLHKIDKFSDSEKNNILKMCQAIIHHGVKDVGNGLFTHLINGCRFPEIKSENDVELTSQLAQKIKQYANDTSLTIDETFRNDMNEFSENMVNIVNACFGVYQSNQNIDTFTRQAAEKFCEKIINKFQKENSRYYIYAHIDEKVDEYNRATARMQELDKNMNTTLDTALNEM